jgi:SRSO17 transposase
MATFDPHFLEEQEQNVETWAQAFDALIERIAPRFAREEAREHTRAYLQGLLSPIQRKNGWQLAEFIGDKTPYALQHLLGRAIWEADALRDDLRAYVVEHLGDPEAVLVVDETAALKKGDKSCGVARQYSGTAGRIENCQVGVFLGYTSPKGHTFLDRQLYLPKEWTEDRERCRAAQVPKDIAFTTKPKLAKQMLLRAFEAGVPARWVTGDAVYGNDRSLQLWLQERRQAFVLAVSGQESVWIGVRQYHVKDLLPTIAQEAWQILSAGEGAKGPRLYEWAWLALNCEYAPEWGRWLLVRRSLTDPSEVTGYICFAPADTPLATLVRVAGTRWTIESCFEAAKGEVGLDEYEVRSWHGWHRHMTLSMLAHAFLTILRATAPDTAAKKGARKPPINRSLAQFKQSRGLMCA